MTEAQLRETERMVRRDHGYRHETGRFDAGPAFEVCTLDSCPYVRDLLAEIRRLSAERDSHNCRAVRVAYKDLAQSDPAAVIAILRRWRDEPDDEHAESWRIIREMLAKERHGG